MTEHRMTTVTDTTTTEPPETTASRELSAAAVIAWLKSHPEATRDHPELLDALIQKPSPRERKKSGNNVADFQAYLIDRLKADKTEAIETIREVVETARYNMNNQTRIHTAVLRLLDSSSFESFIESLTDDLSALLNVDITTLVVESDGDRIPHIPHTGIRLVPEGTVEKWLAGKAILLQSDIGGVETIYGPGASLVRSQILLRINIGIGTPPAILAFGSRDPDLFHPGQGTEQIAFLAQVIERLFRAWLHTSD